MTRYAVVGSRSCMAESAIHRFVKSLDKRDTIVTGGAAGADKIAASAARAYGVGLLLHLPDWYTHGKAAGPIRNELIVRDADALVAWWDGQSKGTAHSIALARKKGIPVTVHYCDGYGQVIRTELPERVEEEK